MQYEIVVHEHNATLNNAAVNSALLYTSTSKNTTSYSAAWNNATKTSASLKWCNIK